MGLFNELQAGRFNDGPSAILGLQEQHGIRTVSPELMTVFVSEGERLEHSFPKFEKRCMARWSQGADVANFSVAGFCNPGGSNVIATIENVYFDGAASALNDMYQGTPAQLATFLAFATTAGAIRDTRYPGWSSLAFGTACTVHSGVLAALGGALIGRIRSPAAGTQVYSDGFVVSPGNLVYFATTAINIAVSGMLTWRERAILPEESGIS